GYCRAALDHSHKPVRHLVAPPWQLVAQKSCEQHGPVSHPGIVNSPIPSDIHLLDSAAQVSKNLNCRQCVSADLLIDAVETEIDGVRHLPVPDIIRNFRKYDFLPNCADVIKVRAGHYILHQCGVRNRTRHRAIVQDTLEWMIEIQRVAAKRRLVSDDTVH